MVSTYFSLWLVIHPVNLSDEVLLFVLCLLDVK